MKAAVEEAECLDNTITVSPAAGQRLLLTSPRYQHNMSSSPRATYRPLLATPRPSVPSTPCQVLDNSEFGDVSASLPTSVKDLTMTRCSSSTAASSATLDSSIVTQPDVTYGADGSNLPENLIRRLSEEPVNTASSVDSMEGNRKSSIKPETTEPCCRTSALPTQSRITDNLSDNTVVTFSTLAITTEIVSHATTTGEYGRAETSTDSGTRADDYASDNNRSSWTTVLSKYKTITTARETLSVVTDLSRNRTFNFVFDGNCMALKRRGPEAEKRFRSVVVDALSSGLSVSAERLVAGELRCGSLNLSVTLLDAGDDDVQWVMSTLAATTLRVSVEDVDETFVLLWVELDALPRVEGVATRVISGHVATTNHPDLSHTSVALLVVFIIIGALAVLAGTVSAAVYLYFRRMHCRTFVVNRRALRWSSRASDTVQVISVDDEDGSSGGGASWTATANNAVEWSPRNSGSGFGDGRLPVGFANWPPHYCQARFRRLIVAPPPALTSLPELLDDEEATVDVTSDHSFHPRRQSTIINLLQPSPVVHELDVGSTDNGGAVTDTDCQCGITNKDISLTGAITFDWAAQDFLTSSNKEKATPF